MRRSAMGAVAILFLFGSLFLMGAPAVVAQPAAEPPEGVVQPAGDPYTVTVTDEMREHQRWLDVLYFVGTAYGFLVLVAVLALGISRRLRDLAGRVTGRPFLAAMIFFALLSVVMALMEMPLSYLGGFFVPHRFALTDQTLPNWLWDELKGLLVGIAVGAPLVALALTGIRKVRRWWLALWIGTAPIAIFLMLVGPVLLDPVFNKFEPLKDESLRQELLALADHAGITGSRVYQVDKSKQTKTMNAYVNGLGPTKRIVLWDTIIAKLDRGELRFVMAHEMGHYVMHHVWKGLGFMLVLLLAVFFLGQRVVEWGTRRWGPKWGFEVAHDPAGLPWLFLVISLFMFLLTPAMNGFSRAIERQSDTFALEMTHLGDAGARAFVKLAEDSKVLPNPNPIIEFWRYSHPALAERIAFCRSYKPWETGAPSRQWHGEPFLRPVPEPEMQ